MTLKEAKRAYKKDNTGFKFTPSQLARADRQDAQEEKRRKALEKQQTRENNKRKREDKAERDRAVKRKMLDEGRIAIEDTWGKVTASQSRLNKFFAQPHTENGPASRLRHEVTRKLDGNAQDNLSDGLEPKDDGHTQTGIVEMKNGPCTVQDTSAPDVLSSLRVSCQDLESVDVRHSLESPRLLHKQSSPLQELHPSQLNVKPKPGATDLRNVGRDHDIEEDFTDGLDDTDFLAFCDGQNNNGKGHDSSATPLHDSDEKTSLTLTLNDHTISTVELNPRGLRNEGSHKHTAFPANGNTKDALPAVVNESFSTVFNEIDESELIAFAEQVEASMETSPQVCSLSTKGAVAEHAPTVSKKSNVRLTPKTKSPFGPEKLDTTFVPVITRSSSLSAENPLDNSGAVLNDTKMIPKPATAMISSNLLPPTEVKPPLVKPKKRRQMPWDDIDGPGPSTQAAMLELLEQAEAQMRR